MKQVLVMVQFDQGVSEKLDVLAAIDYCFDQLNGQRTICNWLVIWHRACT